MSQGHLQGDMLSTSQYYEGRRQRAIDEPILRLMLAVFATAWADASYGGSLRMCVQQRNEAVDWFANPHPQRRTVHVRERLRSPRVRRRRNPHEDLREAGACASTEVYPANRIMPESKTSRATRWQEPRGKLLSKACRPDQFKGDEHGKFICERRC